MRIRIFDLNLPFGVQRCHVSYCTFTDLPSKRRIVFDNFRILYLLNGHGRYWDENHDGVQLRPGSFLLRPPNHVHILERLGDSPWLEFATVLPKDLYTRILDLGGVPASPLLHHLPITENVEDRLQSLFDKADELSSDQSNSFLFEIIDLLLSATNAPSSGNSNRSVPPFIQQAKEILASDLESTIAMPEVAEALGMGYHSFRKAFTKHVGVSPKEFRIRKIIERSQALLLENPHLQLSDIAYELGYPDPPTFSKQFKRVTGQSPSQFRQS